MSIDDTLAALDRLLDAVDRHEVDCAECGKTHVLRPNTSNIARYTCCGTTYDVNLGRPVG